MPKNKNKWLANRVIHAEPINQLVNDKPAEKPWMEFEKAKAAAAAKWGERNHVMNVGAGGAKLLEEAMNEQYMALVDIMKPQQIARNIVMNQMEQLLQKEADQKPKIKLGAGILEQFNLGEHKRQLQLNVDKMWKKVAMPGQIFPLKGERVFMPDNRVFIWEDRWMELPRVREDIVRPQINEMAVQNEWIDKWNDKELAKEGQNFKFDANPNWGWVYGDPIKFKEENHQRIHYNYGQVAAKAEPVNEDEAKISIDKTCNYMAFKEINKKYGKEVAKYKDGEVKMADELQEEFLEIYDNYYDSLTEATVKA